MTEKKRQSSLRKTWTRGRVILAASLLCWLGWGVSPAAQGPPAGHAPAAAGKSSPGGNQNSAFRAQAQTSAAPSGLENLFVGKRDPFKVPAPPSQGEKPAGLAGPLPAGKRGLVIGQLKLEGVVRQDPTHTMIAVVTNRTNRAYFLKVHDEVYDGVVTKITADSLYFNENQLDSNGQVVTREAVKKLGLPPGEE